MNIDNGTLIGIVAAVFAGLGSIVTATLTIHYGNKASRNDKQLANLKDALLHRADEIRSWKRELKNVYGQIASYHALEAIAVGDLSKLTGKSSATVMNDLRTRTAAEGVERPTMTRLHAESQIRFLT